MKYHENELYAPTRILRWAKPYNSSNCFDEYAIRCRIDGCQLRVTDSWVTYHLSPDVCAFGCLMSFHWQKLSNDLQYVNQRLASWRRRIRPADASSSAGTWMNIRRVCVSAAALEMRISYSRLSSRQRLGKIVTSLSSGRRRNGEPTMSSILLFDAFGELSLCSRRTTARSVHMQNPEQIGSSDSVLETCKTNFINKRYLSHLPI